LGFPKICNLVIALKNTDYGHQGKNLRKNLGQRSGIA